MKKLFLLNAFILFFLFPIVAQNNWIWARQGTNVGNNNISSEEYAVAADSAGNGFIAGSFGNTSVVFGNDTLTGTGFLCIVKYSPSGNVLWARTVTAGSATPQALATDSLGNLYVTGSFGTAFVVFGQDTLINSDPSGTTDIFVTKYDPAGNVLWAHSGGGTGLDFGTHIAVSTQGNIFVAGDGAGPLSVFGNYTFNDSNGNFFLLKYDAAGNLLLAKFFGASNSIFPDGIAVDVQENIYIAGDYWSPQLSIGTTTLANMSNSVWDDMFVAKLDNAFNPLWAKNAGGPDVEFGHGLGLDGAGNIYFGGITADTFTTFGSILMHTTSGLFLTKYNNSGNEIWAKTSTGNASGGIYDLQVVGNSYIYVCGEAIGASANTQLVFGADTIHVPWINNFMGDDQSFIAVFDTSGTFLCGDGLPAGGDDFESVAVCNDGVYLGGDALYSPVVIGNDTLGSLPEYIFMTKWRCGNLLSVPEENHSAANENHVYPNPVSEESSFQFYFSPGNTTTLLQIFNANAQLVFFKSVEAGEASVTIPGGLLAPGIYVIQIHDSTSIHQQKLIVE